jgi:PncC family amidohydrolase
MIPESQVNQHLRPLFGPHPARQLTLLASRGHIRIRLIATGRDEERCRSELEEFLGEAKALLPADWIFWEGPDQIELGEPVVKLFQQQGKTIALAESCTGGGVARMLTDVPGCSDVLLEGWVTYSNRSKEERLGVCAMTIAEKGAVSEECAREMAAGAQSRSGADVALAITGIAGPAGGSAEKPVGTVWFALHDREGRSLAHLRRIGGDRETVRRRSEIEALDLLRRWILGLESET